MSDRERVHPRAAGFFSDWRTVALRALRLTWRDPEAFGPALAIPLFFFVVNIGALQAFMKLGGPRGWWKAGWMASADTSAMLPRLARTLVRSTIRCSGKPMALSRISDSVPTTLPSKMAHSVVVVGSAW